MTIEQKAQKFLLDNNCGDLILNDTVHVKSKDWIYASDIMTKFYLYMCESQKKVICEVCGNNMNKAGDLDNYYCPECGWHT